MENKKPVPPVEVGQVVENAQCISLGKKGDGIFKVDRFIVVAPGAEVDKSYNLMIEKVFPTVAFASLQPENAQ